MRVPTWIIAALSAAVPVATMAAEGNPAAGKARAEAAGCFACHGVDGVATENGLAIDKNVPNLAAQPDLYLQFQLVFFRKGVRKNELMNAMAEQLSDDDLRNVSAYFASLPAPNAPRRRTLRPRIPSLAARWRRRSTARTATATISRGWTTSRGSRVSARITFTRPCATSNRVLEPRSAPRAWRRWCTRLATWR